MTCGSLSSTRAIVEALALAAGEAVAALADDRVELFGQRPHEHLEPRHGAARSRSRRRSLPAGRSAGWRGSCRGTGGRPGSPRPPCCGSSPWSVGARRPHRAGPHRDRRRRGATPTRRASTCRHPTTPTSATVWPGSTRNEMSCSTVSCTRSSSTATSSSEARLTWSAEGYRKSTPSNSTRDRPVDREVDGVRRFLDERLDVEHLEHPVEADECRHDVESGRRRAPSSVRTAG